MDGTTPHAAPAQTSSQASRPTRAPDTVVLRVGESRFVVRPSTLTSESPFFDALFSGRWSQAQADGSYYVDSDPVVFTHILRYLRMQAYPLCLLDEETLDRAMYSRILAAADFFGIDDLSRWIVENRYAEALIIQHTRTFYPGKTGVFEAPSGSQAMSVVIESSRQLARVWKCPTLRPPPYAAYRRHVLWEECRLDSECQENARHKAQEDISEIREVDGFVIRARKVVVKHEVLRKG